MATEIKNPWWTDDKVGAQALQMTMPRAAFEPTLLRKPSATAAGNAKRHEFRVLTGAHRDAVFVLGSDDLLVIGAADACDICLTDAGIAQRHATLSLQGRLPSLRALEGTVTVNDQPVAAAARVVLQPGAEIALGESGVRLRLAGDATVRATAAAEAQKAAEIAKKAPPQKSFVRRASMLALVVMVPLAAAGFGLEKLLTARPNAAAEVEPAEPRATPLETLLAEQNLTGRVTVSRTSYGAMLTGVLDRDAATQLQAALPTVGTRVINSTISEDDLIDQVREVFRTRGYEASVAYAGQGRVRVENLDEDNARVQRAAEQVRSDVAQLAELVFAAPGDARPPARVPSYDSGRSERLSVQIDADTAYLSTISGSRYFIGSTLPSGHTVMRITRDAVQVEREGQISWFRF